jgi:hypothetical protein
MGFIAFIFRQEVHETPAGRSTRHTYVYIFKQCPHKVFNLRIISRSGFILAALAHLRRATNRKRHVAPDLDSDSLLWGRSFSDSGSDLLFGGWVIWIRIQVRLEIKPNSARWC